VSTSDRHGELGEAPVLNALVRVVVIVGKDDEPGWFDGVTTVAAVDMVDVGENVAQRLLDEGVSAECLSPDAVSC
jgi:hypothetical protein